MRCRGQSGAALGMTAKDETDEIDEAMVDRVAPIVLQSDSVEHTQEFGRTLGALVRPGDVILLEGELGAGKTAFTQGLGQGLGVSTTINSPTFTILKEYQGRLPLYHFDLYRLDAPDELYELGFRDYFGGTGVCVVEWAERGEFEDDEPPIWNGEWLRIVLRITGEHERTLSCAADSARGQALLAAFASAATATAGSGD
jgi:tRNA threonylcarbamoyladenosine biosynthesis protein TsaE